MNRHSHRGVALVITLIMLSVVTFMAVAFLALSRRERASVTVSTEQATAATMANEALARAQGEIMARLLARTNPFSYDLIVSTNFFNPAGFIPNRADSNNVNFNYRIDQQSLNAQDRVLNMANLQFDPRPPVYIATNKNPRLPLDFRFFLDFNRNGQFETNGYLPVLDAGQPIRVNGQGILSNYFVGDPEWVGVLDHPGLPHSASNRFVGRYAYLVLPAGKSLDLNFIHNQVKAARNIWAANAEGFMRNQGIGSWEINLAAFLRDLNTNEWPQREYTFLNAGNVASRGLAFENALGLVRYRYANSYASLTNVSTLFGAVGANVFRRDLIDGYGDGPMMSGIAPLTSDNDDPGLPWPGSDVPRPFNDVQELFDMTKVPSYPDLPRKLQGLANPATTNSSYDRYTFYRLLTQIGVDSAPALVDKMNLNYASDAAGLATNFIPWTPLGFFTNAAERILKSELTAKMPFLKRYLNPNYMDTLRKLVGTNVFTGLPLAPTLANIPIYPTNFYSLLGIHQLLQEAANLYDATTNRGPSYPYWPSVFRPVFSRTNDQFYINGYVEVNDVAPAIDRVNYPWVDLNVASQRATLPASGVASNINVYGIPWVIGAKKGFPNFNEFALQTAVQISRKIELRKPGPLSRPSETNQMFIVGISNVFGVEVWNSYQTNFPRALELQVYSQFIAALTNENEVALWGTNWNLTSIQSIPAKAWQGNEFRVPLQTNVVFLTNAAYIIRPPYFLPLHTVFSFDRGQGFPVPQWGLVLSNRLQFVAIDRGTTPNRVVDFVNLDNLGTQIDIARELIGNQAFGETSGAGSFWLTNRLANDPIPLGVRNQILESLGQATNSPSIWTDYSQDPVAGDSKEKAIELFRVFVGLSPRNPRKFPPQQMQQELGNSVTHQAPFSPVRKIYQDTSWQVNDPLVHYTWQDLYDYERTNTLQYAVPPMSVPTNSNLGMLNRRYRPWGGNPNISSDTNAYNLALKDSLVKSSDDWEFPTNKFPNIGWLGRVHRGTPWQTVYLKSPVAETNAWLRWAVNPLAHPTNDWQLLDLFTVAPNANAARGLLSVNQTNLAAWSAVLSGISVLSNLVSSALPPANLTNLLVQPDSPQLRQIVESINLTRAALPGRVFHYLGEVLASPALTVNSPFLRPYQAGRDITIPDEVIERIPQQVLSLLKADEPRLVVYSYGQALAPAENSLVVAPATSYNRLCTNYQITAEVVTKNMVRIDGAPTNPVVVPESFQYLPNE